MPRTIALWTMGVFGFATAGRVTRLRMSPCRVTLATWRAKAKVRSAEPSGSTAMFSGVSPAAKSKWATKRGCDTIGSSPEAGPDASTPRATAVAAIPARCGSRGMNLSLGCDTRHRCGAGGRLRYAGRRPPESRPGRSPSRPTVQEERVPRLAPGASSVGVGIATDVSTRTTPILMPARLRARMRDHSSRATLVPCPSVERSSTRRLTPAAAWCASATGATAPTRT